ncbi:CYTH domain-containing protein [Duncaniella freteri]|uniref:CYTH domain-containing protein n=1 Tax=Duncaniella freteri TaxID=2530391 RepID=UPI0025580444|nr:CYTH domain-containing protein [Duncaniella freteri]
MGKEIERKFLVKDNSFIQMTTELRHICQTYISDKPEATVRIRVCDDHAWITVKGKNDGAVRDEWEYAIPVNDAMEMAERLAGGWNIDKTRYVVIYEGARWEVDVFHGRHDGLVLAEIELSSASDSFVLPPFIGDEVTGDPRYYNSVLAAHKQL